MTDRDEALHYLLNKLKSEDGWSSANLTWNDEKLAVISDQFSSFDGVVKAKVLLSFLSMSPRTISQCSNEMQQILRLSRRDGDEWVRLFAAILAPFPHTQSTNVEPCTEGRMEGVQDDLVEILSHISHDTFTPHEFACLNTSVLSHTHRYTVPTHHSHFELRHQPIASVQLRNEMLQKAGMDFTQTGSLVKDRHLMQRQMSASGSNPFVSTSRSSSSRKSVPIPGHSTSRVQRERGTKLLDINEVPTTFKRKRRAAADLELSNVVAGETKRTRSSSKSEPDTPTPTLPLTTPDYAAGLGGEFSSATLGASGSGGSTGEGGGGEGGGRKGSLEVALGVSGMKEAMSAQANAAPSFYSSSSAYQPYLPPSSTSSTPHTPTPLTPHTPLTPQSPPFPPHTPQTPTPSLQPSTPTTPGAKQPSKGLKVTRQQLLVAQEMFRESPNLSRGQKALILGFMAGARENPYPNRDVVTVKLNDRVQWEPGGAGAAAGGGAAGGGAAGGGAAGGGVGRNILIETVFEMNYKTGQWRKLQYRRPVQSN